MLEFLQTVLALIVTVSILVTIHEFGHYWVARLCNVHVLRFSVGFGKPIYMKRGRPPVVQPASTASGAGANSELNQDQQQEPQVMTRSNEPLEGTEFAVAAIPLGGYVKMLDEREAFVPDDLKHLAFNRKNVWQRIAIVAAGPIANFLLAFVAFWLLFAMGETQISSLIGKVDKGSPAAEAGLVAGQRITAIDGRETATWSDVNVQLLNYLGESGSIEVAATDESGTYTSQHQVQISGFLAEGGDEQGPMDVLGLHPFYPELPPVIGDLVEGGRAEAAGLQTGDKILSVNAASVQTWDEVTPMIKVNAEVPMRFLVQRGAITREIEVTPKAVEVEVGDQETGENGSQQVGIIGVYAQGVPYPEHLLVRVNWPFYLAWLPAAERTWQLTAFTFASIGKMITGAISSSNIAGPVTIAQTANESAQHGADTYIFFLALLSISLGVINLLPIPVLDGGHLLFYSIEAIIGKPVPEKVQIVGLNIGVAMLVGLMGLAFYNDFVRLL